MESQKVAMLEKSKQKLSVLEEKVKLAMENRGAVIAGLGMEVFFGAGN